MKKRERKTKKNTKENDKMKSVIDVSGKKDILIIEFNINSIGEEDFRCLLNELDGLNKEVKTLYFSSHEAVEKVKNRSFLDIIKLWFCKGKYKNCTGQVQL